MKLNLKIYSILLLTGVLLTFASCHKDKDTSISALDKHINEFIYGNMYYAYLWNASVADLSAGKFTTQSDYDSYMSKTANHENFFDGLLYKKGTIDKWSWIVDDYVALEKLFQGETKSMGFEFALSYISNSSNKIMGIVEYVVKGSPAYRAGIQRGYIFSKINDVDLTDKNYSDLLYNLNSYKISFGTYTGSEVTLNGVTKNLVAEEVYENPILMDSVYTYGSKKIGYLFYNGFMTNYHKELNDIFGKFKNEGVTDLVLDLRYNGGGSIYTSICLASMIYKTDTTQIYAKTKYNTYLQNLYQSKYGSDIFNYYFEDSVLTDMDNGIGEPINSLNLSKVYILTTKQTASASEMVINGLKTHMNVKTIGTTTHGKYVGSMTLYDIDDQGDTVKTHHWALQPIVVKISNSNNVSDFVNGLAPSIEAHENIYDLAPLGSIDEPLLNAALSDINTTTSARVKNAPVSNLRNFGYSKQRNALYDEMYLDKNLQKIPLTIKY